VSLSILSEHPSVSHLMSVASPAVPLPKRGLACRFFGQESFDEANIVDPYVERAISELEPDLRQLQAFSRQIFPKDDYFAPAIRNPRLQLIDGAPAVAGIHGHHTHVSGARFGPEAEP